MIKMNNKKLDLAMDIVRCNAQGTIRKQAEEAIAQALAPEEKKQPTPATQEQVEHMWKSHMELRQEVKHLRHTPVQHDLSFQDEYRMKKLEKKWEEQADYNKELEKKQNTNSILITIILGYIAIKIVAGIFLSSSGTFL
jgi:hypothetical protein